MNKKLNDGLLQHQFIHQNFIAVLQFYPFIFLFKILCNLFTTHLRLQVACDSFRQKLYNIMIAGIPFVLAGQLKTNTPHYIHFF